MISTGGDDGLVSKRKRVRGKVGDPSKHPELKKVNGFFNSELQADNGDWIIGAYWPSGTTKRLWYPMPLEWPSHGTGSAQMVGKRIRVKMLRLKGFVLSSPFLIMQVRWRIVLYRCLKSFVNSTETYNMNWVSYNYKKWYDMTSTDTGALQLAAWQNYYASFFDQEAINRRELKRRILVKGVLNPNEDIGNYRNALHEITGGSNTLNVLPYYSTGVYQRHFEAQDVGNAMNMKSAFPIDVTVEMNDNVDCDQYRYILQIESDTVMGQTDQGAFATSQANANFIFYLVPQIYFTDE